MPDLLPTAAVTALIYMTAVFILAQLLGNNSIVDIAWGLGFIVVTAVLFAARPGLFPAKVLVAALVLVWGLRLAAHILRRNLGKPEDFRYAAMRRKWGRAVRVKAFFFVFMFQGLLMLVVSLPITVVLGAPARPLALLDVAGAAVFAAGFLYEVVGDLQLAAHVRNPANKGTLMTRGLWATTRHPNYFGEALLWWGVGLIALSSAGGWIAPLGPLTITLFLVFVSGVPLLERKYAGRPDWEAYKARTPMFVPRFPKRRPEGSGGTGA
jgi:steroid 5-alpha reductase family enzyme